MGKDYDEMTRNELLIELRRTIECGQLARAEAMLMLDGRPRPPGGALVHIDGDPSNNEIGNLEWRQASENRR